LALETLAEPGTSLAADDEIAMHFALGKAYADLDQNERAFRHLVTANALKRRGVIYDQLDTLRTFAGIRAVFGRAIDVNYEEVVADLETQARRMVAHCGLDWQPRCLNFYNTPRGVRAASATQVRQPHYRHDLGRWHRYQQFLEPLLQALNGADAKALPTGHRSCGPSGPYRTKSRMTSEQPKDTARVRMYFCASGGKRAHAVRTVPAAANPTTANFPRASVNAISSTI